MLITLIQTSPACPQGKGREGCNKPRLFHKSCARGEGACLDKAAGGAAQQRCGSALQLAQPSCTASGEKPRSSVQPWVQGGKGRRGRRAGRATHDPGQAGVCSGRSPPLASPREAGPSPLPSPEGSPRCCRPRCGACLQAHEAGSGRGRGEEVARIALHLQGHVLAEPFAKPAHVPARGH